MKKFTNLIILDASGSMASKVDAVRSGIIELIKSIKADFKKHPSFKIRTIICMFAGPGDFEAVVNSTDKSDLKKSIASSYVTGGTTALFDAICTAFSLVPKKQDGVFVSIMTDGLENSSQEYSYDNVKRMLLKAKKNKWGITFMGTTEDALSQAKSLGIVGSNTIKYSDNSRGVKKANTTRNRSRTVYFNSVAFANTKDQIKITDLVEEES